MSEFVFDALIQKHDFCNMRKVFKQITEGVENRKKLVIYGPRNFGKTSMIKNLVVPEFKKKNKKSFVFFCDLMEVKSLEAIVSRMQLSFSESFAETFPGKNLIEGIKTYLSQLRPKIEMDSLTGQTGLTFFAEKGKTAGSISEIFQTIQKKIAPEIPSLIIFDEFQDIAFVEQAQGLFRKEFQEITNTPILLLGSKKHLLAEIFSKPRAPLAGFGVDIEFEPIPYSEYHDYIQKRFSEKKISISLPACTYLQELLHRIPESINIVCDHILRYQFRTTVSEENVNQAIADVVNSRRSRFEAYLSQFTEKQEKLLITIAKNQPISEPNSILFISKTGLSARTISLNLKNFLHHSVVEKVKDGWKISDPLLSYFLKKYR